MTLFHSGTLRGGCSVCGAQHAACGGPSDAVPVDERLEAVVVGGPLRRYEITTPSGAKTVVKLNDADARRYGVLGAEPPVVEEQSEVSAPVDAEVSNKARRPAPRARGGRSSDSA